MDMFILYLHSVYEPYTMVPINTFQENLELCKKYQNVPGDYVECGTWKGGMSAAIAEVLDDGRTFHLFDSFKGLPPAQDIDGHKAIAWQKNINDPAYYNNCKAEFQDVVNAMAINQCENYKVYPGWFKDSLSELKTNSIGILRIDCDWYQSVKECLDTLMPKVNTGGLIIIDDYHAWDGCAKAVHDHLSETKSSSRIHQCNNGTTYIIKA